MENHVSLNIIHNRNKQILSGKSNDEVNNDYMTKISNIETINDEKSIKDTIYLIDNFKYFLTKRYYDSKNMSEEVQNVYNAKLNGIRSQLIEKLFNLRVTETDNYQKIKRK